jgi:5'-nucleotidase
MDDAVDVIVAGHTHSRLNSRVDGKLLVESWAYGTGFDKVDLEVDRRSGDVVAMSADTPRTWNDEVEPDDRLAALTRKYAKRVAPLANRVVGRAGRDLHGARLGRLVADAQRAYARTDFAVTNPGAMRDGVDAGRVTYGDLFRVHAYEHRLMRMELTGADLKAVLERQWSDGATTMLHVSGFRFDYDSSRPLGERVTRIERAGGRPVRPDRSYTLVANELIAKGEAFSALRDGGRRKRLLDTDLEALVAHVRRLGTGL